LNLDGQFLFVHGFNAHVLGSQVFTEVFFMMSNDADALSELTTTLMTSGNILQEPPLTVTRITAGVSAAQPDNGACAGYQASTQLDPVVIEARSAEENHGAKPRPLIKSRSAAKRLDQRWRSGAAGSGSDVGADAGSRRLQRFVGPAMAI